MKTESSFLSIIHGQVLLPDGVLASVPITVEQGRIARLGVKERVSPEIDAAGGYVVPGLIDLHSHGLGHESAYGHLKAYADGVAAQGTTTVFLTMFGPPELTAEHMRRHLAETEGLRQTPNVGGFRLESPYLAFAGGGVSKDLAPISASVTDLLMVAGAGHIRIWDVSPELPGAPETIRQLSKAGLVCSLAHTRATIAQARMAVEAGARLVTHLFDTFVLPPATTNGIYPPGLVDYLLVEDRLICEIIPDGTHVDPLLVEKAWRCKPADGLVFVTDSNMGAGLPAGDYTLIDGERIRIAGVNQGVRLVDRDLLLFGSAMTSIHCFRNTLQLFGKDLAAASRVCSRNPARLMGLNKGEIKEGRDADLVILDKEFNVLYTVVAGKVVYRKG